jgi:hypothetical protein
LFERRFLDCPEDSVARVPWRLMGSVAEPTPPCLYWVENPVVVVEVKE